MVLQNAGQRCRNTLSLKMTHLLIPSNTDNLCNINPVNTFHLWIIDMKLVRVCHHLHRNVRCCFGVGHIPRDCDAVGQNLDVVI